MFAPQAPQPPHSALETAGVAIKQWWTNFFIALGNCVTGKAKERVIYAGLADASLAETPEQLTADHFPLFDSNRHRKYFGHIYYQTADAEGNDPKLGPLKPMEDPPREEHAQHAYDDFLRGLEMINQQEYLKQEFCGKGFETTAIENTPPEVLFTDVDIKKRDYNADTVWEKAKWERLMMLRRHATSARSFYEQLKDRAEAENTTHPDKWLKFGMDSKGPNSGLEPKAPLRRPPIRWRTFEMLTRPLEADWSLALFFSWAFAIFTYVFTLYTQIQAIADMCSGGYICPGRDVTVPLMAPPYALRQGQANALFYEPEFGERWNPFVQAKCTIEDPLCDTPGYKIQWPMVQLNATSQTAAYPPELLDKCTLKENGADWVWDPFTHELRNSFLDCTAEDDVDAVKFEVDGVSFHFEPDWYNEARETTVKCMLKWQPKYSIPADLTRWQEGDEADEFLEAVDQCMLSDSGLDDHLTHCQCSTSKPQHPIKFFYANDPIKTCEGEGEFEGLLCDNDEGNDCGSDQQATCTARYPEDHNPLATSPLYGCFFEQPWAERAVQVRYHICGMTLDTHDESGNLKSKLQRAVTPNIISKKAGLMITFAIKEASYLTGVVVLFVISAVLTVVSLPLLILYGCFHSRWGSNAPVADAHLLQIKDAIGAVLWQQCLTLWSTCVNFSTFYRMIKFAISLSTGHVNVSVHDLDKKLTGVANLMYNLVLLVFQDEVDASIYVSLALSLALLLYQMNAEKQGLRAVADVLKDINEMRLSKFEMALGLNKVMEDMLEYDIEYNWVAHFYSKEKLYPIEADPEFDVEDHLKTHGQNADKLDLVEDEKTTLRFMPSMATAMAREWGHDGKGEFSTQFRQIQAQEFDELNSTQLKLAQEKLERVFSKRPHEADTAITRITKTPKASSMHKTRGGPLLGMTARQAAFGGSGGTAMSSREGSANFAYPMQPMMGSMPPMQYQPGPMMQPGYNPYSGMGGSMPPYM